MKSALAYVQLTHEPINDSVGALDLRTANPVAIYMSQMACGSSRKTTLWRLEKVVEWLTEGTTKNPYDYPWSTFTLTKALAYKDYLSRRVHFTSCNGVISAIRKLVQICWTVGVLSADTWREFQLFTKIKGERCLAGRMLSRDELTTLLEAAKVGRKNERRRALLFLLYGCGLRISETTNLTTDDLIIDDGRIMVEVRGKGNKTRRVPVPTSLAPWLQRYAKRVWTEAEHEGLFVAYLFPSRMRSNRPIRPENARGDLQSFAATLGLEHFTPHDMRRTYISELFNVGADVAIIAKLVGHANISQTAKYDRRGEDAKCAAADKLPLVLK